MAGWIGPTVALSLLVIAICVVAMAAAAVLVLREAASASKGVTRELEELRHELAPMLTALNRFGDTGSEVVEMARNEVEELVDTSRQLRGELRRGMVRAQERLADFDALVEVMQEEVEDTAIDAATALRTLRGTDGVVRQVGRLLRPRRRTRD